MIIKRKEIWWLDLEPTKGKEIRKVRPIIVVNSDVINQVPNFDLRIIVPLTSWQEKYSKGWFVKITANAENGLKNDSAVDPFQIRCVSLSRFKEKIGMISNSQMQKIEQKLFYLLR